MASTSEFVKLAQFVGKDVMSVGEHLTHAAMGAGAKGVANLVTGNDLTDGMLGAGVMGAAAGVGLRAYKNRNLAPHVASAMKRMASAEEKFAELTPKIRNAAKGSAERAALNSQARPYGTIYRDAQKDLTAYKSKMGWTPEVKANAPKAVAPTGSGPGVGTSGTTQTRAAASAPPAGASNASKSTSTVSASSPMMDAFYPLKQRSASMSDFYPTKGPSIWSRAQSSVDRVYDRTFGAVGRSLYSAPRKASNLFHSAGPIGTTNMRRGSSGARFGIAR